MQVIAKPFGMIDFANKVREMIETNSIRMFASRGDG
jgi:hypothetical protein